MIIHLELYRADRQPAAEGRTGAADTGPPPPRSPEETPLAGLPLTAADGGAILDRLPTQAVPKSSGRWDAPALPFIYPEARRAVSSISDEDTDGQRNGKSAPWLSGPVRMH